MSACVPLALPAPLHSDRDQGATETLFAKVDLAKVLLELDGAVEAEELLLSAFKGLGQLEAAQQKATECANALADLYEARGDSDGSQKWRSKANSSQAAAKKVD